MNIQGNSREACSRRNVLLALSPFMAPAAFVLAGITSLVGWMLYPNKNGWWFAPLCFLIMWLVDRCNFAWVGPPREAAARQTQFALRLFLLATAVIGSASKLVSLAIAEELIDADWFSVSRRATGILVSVSLVVFGNYLPKLPSPWLHEEEPFDWQGVHRFAGIAFMVCGGLTFLAWMSLPVAEAKTLNVSLFLTMAILVVCRKFYSLATWHSPGRTD